MKKFYIYFLVQFLFLALSTNATGYHGVFAGINDYPGTSSDLSYCVKDAEDIRYWFIHKKNWLSENCALKLNSDADEWDIRNAIQAMPNNNNNNNVFTFSGHGDSYQLGGYDGLIPANSFYARITPSEIQTWFGYNYNQYANFLDACGSGVFPDNMGKGVICSACKANEYALESGSIQHGYYSYYVI